MSSQVWGTVVVCVGSLGGGTVEGVGGGMLVDNNRKVEYWRCV